MWGPRASGNGKSSNMRLVSKSNFIAFAIACMLAGASLAQTRDVNEPHDDLRNVVSFGYDNFLVNKDRGRFREDRWMTDQSTGGLDRLYVVSETDPNGYQWILEGRALYDYDYELSLLMRKKDSHYLLLDFTGLRRYFDGSNEPWDAPVPELAEKSDADLFVDRRTYNIEFGLTPEDDQQFLLGWRRLVKDGKEVLLRGAEGVTTGSETVSSVPVVANGRGITDTFYAEAAQTFAEKYNLRVRQEFEQYHDNRKLDISSFDAAGAVDKSDIVDDDLGYTNWRTMLMFDSTLNEENYVTANYMYNYLNNNSTRDIVGYHEVTTYDGGNSKRTNVGAFGYRADNIARVENLSLTAGLRVEDSSTRSHMSGSGKFYNFLTGEYDGPKPRVETSRLDEVPVSETLRLTYQGVAQTTLSFDADLEQRALRWSERDQHGGVLSDPDLSRKADIDITDQIYTFKAVRRLSRTLKSTLKLRIKDLERSYTDRLDETAFYPGYLGSYRTTGSDVSLAADCALANNATARLLYQFINESIDTSLGGRTQNLEVHRGAGTLSFSPAQSLFLVGTFMLDNYDLDTPAVGVAADHAQGSRPFDFRGTSYSLLLDGTYAFNAMTSCTFGFQHTEALGTVDFAGDYAFDSVGLMFKFKRSRNQTVGVGYQFLNFNSHSGSFDDYSGHGLRASYTYMF